MESHPVGGGLGERALVPVALHDSRRTLLSTGGIRSPHWPHSRSCVSPATVLGLKMILSPPFLTADA
jgi:hypothetical protein